MITKNYAEAIVKLARGEVTVEAMRRVISDPRVKLPIGFYKECRSKGVHLHSKRKYVYEMERMFQ